MMEGGGVDPKREGSQRACTGIYKWRKGLSVTWPGDANKATQAVVFRARRAYGCGLLVKLLVF